MKRIKSRVRKRRMHEYRSTKLLPVFFLIVILGITILFLGQKQTFTPNAQTVPSPACLGSCPGASGTTAPAVQTGTQPSAMVSSGTATALGTGGSVATNVPATAPCMTIVQTSQSHEHQRGLLSGIGNFFLTFVMELFKVLLQLLLGGGFNTAPTQVATPTISTLVPTNTPQGNLALPCPQTSPAVIAAAPTTAAAPTLSSPTASPVSASPATVGQVVTQPATLPIDQAGLDSIWGGYVLDVASGATNDQVIATWNVPTVDCTSISGQDSAWVGMGGFNSSDKDLPQVGVDFSCNNGSAKYEPWTEAYPASSVYLNYNAKPGDSITGSITHQNGSTYATKLSDANQNWSVDTPMTFQDGKNPQTADVAIEAVFDGGNGVSKYSPPLTFTNATYQGKPIGQGANLKHIELINQGSQKTSTSGFDPTGTSFSISWQAQ